MDHLYYTNSQVQLHNRIFNIDTAANAMSVQPRASLVSLAYKVNITLSHEVYFYKSRSNKKLDLRTSQGQDVLSKFLYIYRVVQY